LLLSRDIDLTGEQQTKTKTALEFFTAPMQETRAMTPKMEEGART